MQNTTAFASARRLDKCMKHLWPNVLDACEVITYHGACEARVSHFASKYGGSCDEYCASFGFQCAGGREVGSEPGCESSSSTRYLSCSDRSSSTEAICSCSDPLDTFLWRDALRTCGPGRALVAPSGARTCADFCSTQGLVCGGCAEADGEACTPGASASCSAPIASAGGSICECAGTYDRSGAFKWPDKLEYCATSTVLVSGKVLKAQGGNCDGYCRTLRRRVPGYDLYFSCFGAWPSLGQGCRAYTSGSSEVRSQLRGAVSLAASSRTGSCQQDFDGADAVCSCSFADL